MEVPLLSSDGLSLASYERKQAALQRAHRSRKDRTRHSLQAPQNAPNVFSRVFQSNSQGHSSSLLGNLGALYNLARSVSSEVPSFLASLLPKVVWHHERTLGCRYSPCAALPSHGKAPGV